MFEVEAGADEKQQIKFVWPYARFSASIIGSPLYVAHGGFVLLTYITSSESSVWCVVLQITGGNKY